MFTKDQLSALLHANGKEGIMATVNQITGGRTEERTRSGCYYVPTAGFNI